ncbi:MAG: Ig-like domain-containing protein, partial [Candidatus Thermoplasmatota archaeon]|nr:Ig-like domain-containing protein [Candidatus Thermoplasmatota archaeon]
GMNSFQEWTSCINFLVLTGRFEDFTDIGQTIPFEAVLVTPEPELTVTPDPSQVVPGEGLESQSTINATLSDSLGVPIPNTLIRFSSTLGTITPYAITDSSGVVTVTFVAGSTTGRATISASTQGITESIVVTIK